VKQAVSENICTILYYL